MNSRLFTFILCLFFVITTSAQDFTLRISEMKSDFSFSLRGATRPVVNIDWGDGNSIEYAPLSSTTTSFTVPGSFSKMGEPVVVKIYGDGAIQYFAFNDNTNTSFESFEVTDDNSVLDELLLMSCPLQNLDVAKASKLAIIICSYTDLTTVDLSENTLIEKAAFSGCANMETLTIPASSTTLKTLELNYTPLNISVLEDILTNAPALEMLKLSKTVGAIDKLTAIDLSANKNLIELWLDNNSLGGVFDLSENTALERVHLEGNEIELLDVKSESLVLLHAENNKISTLDLSGIPALKTLYCENNLLSSLDLTNQTSFGALYAKDNQLRSLSFAPEAPLTRVEINNNYFNFETLPRIKPTTYTFTGQKDSLTIALGTDFKSVDMSDFMYPIASGELVPGTAGRQSTMQWFKVNEDGSTTGLSEDRHYRVSGNIVTFDSSRLNEGDVVYCTVSNAAYRLLVLYTNTVTLFVDSGVGIDEDAADDTALYYQKTSDSVVYTLAGAESATVYNLSGQVIYQSTLNQDSGSIDFSNLENGIYIVQVKSQGESLTQKIIK